MPLSSTEAGFGCGSAATYAPDRSGVAGNALRADGSLLKPFLDPSSELTGIDMLLSQSGSSAPIIPRDFPGPLNALDALM